MWGNYQETKASGIVAGYSALQVLEAIFATFGFVGITGDMINRVTSSSWWTDGSSALQPYYDDLASEYEKTRLEIINGGLKPQPSVTPDPEPSPVPSSVPDPEPEPEIPTFSKLINLGATAGFLDLAQNTWDCLSEAVSNLWDKILGRPQNVDKGIPAEEANFIKSSGYPYFVRYKFKYDYRGYEPYVLLCGEGSFRVSSQEDGYFCSAKKYLFRDGSFIYQDVVNGSTHDYSHFPGYYTNLPNFKTFDEGFEWSKNAIANKHVKEEIWVTPELQNTYQNNGKLEYPQQAPRPINIPTIEQLQELVRKLNPEINPDYAPEMAPNYIQEFIESLKKDPVVNPSPDPGVGPDPGPKPTGAPLPTGAPKPSGTPDIDDPQDLKPQDYQTDLREIFPFCIPFDLVRLIKVFQAEPLAPVFEFPVDIEWTNPFNGRKILNYHHTFKLDMKDYESVVQILRIFQVVFFIIGLMMITRQHMIKG